MSDITDTPDGRARREVAFMLMESRRPSDVPLGDLRVYRKVSALGEGQALYAVADKLTPLATLRDTQGPSGEVHVESAITVDPVLMDEIERGGQPYSSADADSRTRTGTSSSNGSWLTENGTGWMFSYWRVDYEGYSSGDNRYVWSVNQEATHKSKSIWTMYKARIRSVPYNTSYIWMDHDPAADADHGNCRTGTLSVQYGGFGASYSTTFCDRWDIGFFPSTGGRFDNTWFGDAWRSERHVEYLLLVKRGVKNWGFTFHQDFWAI